MASIRALARIEILLLKAQTEKLDTVLTMLVKYVDTKNYDKIMKEKPVDLSPVYFDVLKI